MKIKRILITTLLVIVFGGCATTGTGPSVEPDVAPKVEQLPDEPLNIIFAGFAFLGDCRENEKLYPFISRLAESATCPNTSYQELNKRLFKAAERINNPGFKLKLSGGADINKGETFSLAFAISKEKTRIQGFRGKFLVHYEVYAQGLVFDFAKNVRQVIATFPVRMQYSDMVNEKPSDAYSLEIFRKILLDPGFEANIVKQWVDRMNSVKIKESYGNYIKVAKVDVPAETLQFVPDNMSAKGGFATQTAQFLETSLSANQLVPVIPYAEGESVGKMRVMFTGNTIYDLKLPEPDYGIFLKVRPFKKFIIDKKNYSQVTYGSFIDVKLRQISMEETYMEASFRNVPMATIDKTAGVKLNDWDEFQKSLQNLLDQFTKQISERSSDWIDNATRTENVKSQFGKFMSVLSDVR
jgi:hypothetical protein